MAISKEDQAFLDELNGNLGDPIEGSSVSDEDQAFLDELNGIVSSGDDSNEVEIEKKNPSGSTLDEPEPPTDFTETTPIDIIRPENISLSVDNNYVKEDIIFDIAKNLPNEEMSAEKFDLLSDEGALDILKNNASIRLAKVNAIRQAEEEEPAGISPYSAASPFTTQLNTMGSLKDGDDLSNFRMPTDDEFLLATDEEQAKFQESFKVFEDLSNQYFKTNSELLDRISKEDSDSLLRAKGLVGEVFYNTKELLSDVGNSEAVNELAEGVHEFAEDVGRFRGGVVEGFEGERLAKADAEFIFTHDKFETLDYIEEQYSLNTEGKTEEELDLISARGFGNMVGGQLLPIIKTVAATAGGTFASGGNPIVGAIVGANVGAVDAAETGFGANFRQAYFEARQNSMKPEAAYEVAFNMALVGAAGGAIEGAIGAIGIKGLGKFAPKTKFAKWLVSTNKDVVGEIGEFAIDISLDAGTAASIQRIDNEMAQGQGIVTRGNFDGVADAALGEAIFSSAVAVPRTVSGGYKKWIKTTSDENVEKVVVELVKAQAIKDSQNQQPLYRALIDKENPLKQGEAKENPESFFENKKVILEKALTNEGLSEIAKKGLTEELSKVNKALVQGIPDTFTEIKTDTKDGATDSRFDYLKEVNDSNLESDLKVLKESEPLEDSAKQQDRDLVIQAYEAEIEAREKSNTENANQRFKEEEISKIIDKQEKGEEIFPQEQKFFDDNKEVVDKVVSDRKSEGQKKELGDKLDAQKKLNEVSNKIDKREQVNENDIEAAINEALAVVDDVNNNENISPEDKKVFEDLVFKELDKLENYDLTTKTETSTTTETTEVRGIRKIERPQREARQDDPNQRIVGREVETDSKSDGTTKQVIEKGGREGQLSIQEFDADGKKLNSQNLVDSDGNVITDVNQLEFVNSIFDEDGAVSGVVLKAGDTEVTVLDEDLAIDLAAKQIESTIGDVDNDVFESFVSEVTKTVTTETEVLINEPTQVDKNVEGVKFQRRSANLKDEHGVGAVEESNSAEESIIKAITQAMNGLSLSADLDVSKLNDEGVSNTTDAKIDVEDLNSRLDKPLKVIKDIADWANIPMLFTISDQLAAGRVVNPFTGEVMADIKGGLGFNGLKEFFNMAWANTDEDTANDTLTNAKELYKNNKALYDKLWAEGKLKEGQVLMGVIKMGKESIASNEALMRVAAINIKNSFPKKNQKKAFNALIKDLNFQIDRRVTAIEAGLNLKGEKLTDGTKSSYEKLMGEMRDILSLTEANNIKDLIPLMEQVKSLKIGSVAVLSNKIFSGNLTGKRTEKFGDLTDGANDILQALYDGVEDQNTEKIAIQALAEAIEEPSMKDVPQRHLIAFQAVDIFEKDKNGNVITEFVRDSDGNKVKDKDGNFKETKKPLDKPEKITHPNYPYGVKGESIGVLESPVHVADVFSEVEANIVAQIAKKEGNKKPITAGQAMQNGAPVSSALSNTNLRGISIKQRLTAIDKLNGLFRVAFPNTEFFNNKNDFDLAMSDPRVKKELRRGDIVYGFTIDGKVFLNPDIATAQTALHEVGHIWMDFMKDSNPKLHARGLKLVDGRPEYAQAKLDNPDNDALAREEALVELMANKGDLLFKGATAKDAEFKNWMLALMEHIKKSFKSLKGLSLKKINKLTLEEFTQGMLADVLSGKDITDVKKIDDLVQAKLVKFEGNKGLDPLQTTKSGYVKAAAVTFMKKNNAFLKKNLKLSQIQKHIESFMGHQWSKNQVKFSKKNTLAEAEAYLNDISKLNYWNQKGFGLDEVANELYAKGIDRNTAEIMALEAEQKWSKKVTTVASETTGLTQIEKFKQGFVEFANAKKDEIRSLKEKLKSEVRKANITANEKARAKTDAKQGLVNFINKVFSKKDIIGVPLLKSAISANTTGEIQKVMDRLLNLKAKNFEKERVEARNKTVKNIKKNFKPHLKKDSNKVKRPTITNETRDEINELQRDYAPVLDLMEDADLVALNSLLESIVETGETDLNAKKALKDSHIKFVRDKTISTITKKVGAKGVKIQTVSDAVAIMEKGKKDFVFIVGDDVYDKFTIDLFKKNLEGETEVDGLFINISKTEEARIKGDIFSGTGSQRRKILNRFTAGNMDFEGFITALTTDDESKEFYKKNVLNKMIQSDLDQENDKGNLGVKLNELKIKVFGKTKFKGDAVYKKSSARLTENSGIKLKNLDGNDIRDGKLSNDQAVALYSALKRPTTFDKAEAAGITPEDINTLGEYINSNPDLKAYAEGLEGIYKETLPEINKALDENFEQTLIDGVYESRDFALSQAKTAKEVTDINKRYDVFKAIYGKEVEAGQEIPYTPTSVSGDEVAKSSLDILSNTKNLSSIISGNLIEVKTGGALSLNGSSVMFDKYLNGMVRMKNKMSAFNDLTKIFNEKTLSIIRENYGNKFADAFESSLRESLVGRDASQEGLGGMFSRWQGGAAAVQMFLNYKSAAIQHVSMANFGIEDLDDSSEYLRLLGGSLSRIKPDKEVFDVRKEIATTGWVINRLKQNASSLELVELNKGGTAATRIIAKILDVGYTPTRHADARAIIKGGAPFFLAKRRELFNKKVKNMSIAQAKEESSREAHLALFDSAQRGQQSSLESRTSQQQRDPVKRAFLTFGTTGLQMNRIALNAAKDLKNGRGSVKNNLAKIGVATVINNGLYFMFTSMMPELFPEDRELSKNEETFKLGNRFVDTIARGFGLWGVAFSVVKNLAYDISLFAAQKGGKSKRSEAQQEILDILTLDGSNPKRVNIKSALLKSLGTASPKFGIKAKSFEDMSRSLGDGDVWEAGANFVELSSNAPVAKAIKRGQQVKDFVDPEDLYTNTEQYLRLFDGISRWGIEQEKKRKGESTGTSSGNVSTAAPRDFSGGQ